MNAKLQVSHSERGIAIQAALILRAALDKVNGKDVNIKIITVATLAVNNSKSPEKPKNAGDAIGVHIHINNSQNKVQIQLAKLLDGEKYEHRNTDEKTQNIQLVVSSEYNGTTTDAHSVDHDKPDVIK